MADTLLRAQVTIPLDDGTVEHSIVNTLYFDIDEASAPDTPSDAEVDTAVVGLLTAFYQAIDGVIFPSQIANVANVRLYNMRDPEPRAVRSTSTIALTPNAGNMFPGEVAICLSFQADQISGVPQARRRGRIFLGPIVSTAVEYDSAGAYIAGGVRNTLATAASTLAAGTSVEGSGVRWAVYSRTTDALSSIDDAFHDVANGWIDVNWDTQRRRGRTTPGRTLWT